MADQFKFNQKSFSPSPPPTPAEKPSLGKPSEGQSNVHKDNPYSHKDNLVHQDNPYANRPDFAPGHNSLVNNKPKEDVSLFEKKKAWRDKQMIREVYQRIKSMPYKKRLYRYNIKEKKSYELKNKAKEIVKSLPDTISPGVHDEREAKRALFLQRLQVGKDRREHKNAIKSDTKRWNLFRNLFEKKK